MDRRAVKQADWIRDQLGAETFKICGNLSDAGNTAPKIMWMKENERELYENTHMFLQANGYLVFKLTGYTRGINPRLGYLSYVILQPANILTSYWMLVVLIVQNCPPSTIVQMLWGILTTGSRIDRIRGGNTSYRGFDG